MGRIKLFSRLPKGPFGTVVADPPWKFNNTATRAAAENHYRTLTLEEILSLPVLDRVKDKAHLYLWTTSSHLKDALRVLEVWGFEFKQTLVWVKICGEFGDPIPTKPKLRIGLGNWYRQAHELCLFGVRGKAQARFHNLPSVLYAPRQQHSAKPTLLLDCAELLSPGPYLELFARNRRADWTGWGNGLRALKEAA